MMTAYERLLFLEDLLKDIYEECEQEIEVWNEEGKPCPADTVYSIADKIKKVLNS